MAQLLETRGLRGGYSHIIVLSHRLGRSWSREALVRSVCLVYSVYLVYSVCSVRVVCLVSLA